jgi:hypothetical protein
MKTLRLPAVPLRAAAGSKSRKLFIVGYTGGVMRVAGFGPIVIDLAGMEIPSSLTILVDHENAIGSVAGSGKAEVVNGQLHVAAQLVDSEAADTVVRLLEGGVQLQASVGADPLESERIAPGTSIKVNGQTLTDADGFTFVKRSRLREMTITPLAADPGTSVSLAARAVGGSAVYEKAMLKAAKANGNAKAAKFTDDDIDKMSEADAKAALKKCMAEGDAEPDDDKPAEAAALIEILAGLPQDVQLLAARQRWTPRQCRAEALHARRSSRPGANVGNGMYRGSGHADTSADVIQAALMVRAGGEAAALKAYGERSVQAARETGLARAPFSEIFAAHLRANGIDPGPRRDIEGMIQAAGPSTASLTNLLSNSLNKLLEIQWPQAPGTWRSWCAIRAAKDFKPAKSLRPVFNGDLAMLAPGGEIEHGNLSDSMIEWQVSSFAKMFTITRAAIINDDLSGLTELPMGLALMADRAVSDLVYYGLLNNTGTFFSTDHGNNQSSGSSALSSASLTTAIKQMRLQVGPNNAPLSIPPATLVVGPALEQTAKEILHSSFQFRDQSADKQPAGNPLAQAVNLVVEPRLSLGATNPINKAIAAGVPAQWFLFSTPAFLPGIVGFLNGAEAPQVQPSDPLGYNFDIPGQSYRCLYDFGFALGDFRAAQRAVGS